MVPVMLCADQTLRGVNFDTVNETSPMIVAHSAVSSPECSQWSSTIATTERIAAVSPVGCCFTVCSFFQRVTRR